MAQQLSSHRVELTFVGLPPARQVARASGVTEVEVDGHRLRCCVCGSFQPFLEALHGSEVISLTSTHSSCRSHLTKGVSDHDRYETDNDQWARTD
jgi:hypothetical protein